jgi:hypothetical protein
MKWSRMRRLLTEPVPIHRLSAHLFFACFVWPVLTIIGAAWALKHVPYRQVSWPQAFSVMFGVTLLRLPDLVLVGAIFFGLSAFIFKRFGTERGHGRFEEIRFGLEPLVTFVIAIAGIAVWYPAVLSQPLFVPVDFLPVAGVLGLLIGAGVLGIIVTGRSGKRLQLACALLAVAVLSPGVLWLRTTLERSFGAPPTVLLLGVDSISHVDDLSPLMTWVERDGGTWYERAVTPGLFTNPVWTSILTLKPVHEHRIFHTFERMRASDAALLQAARAQGYRTIGAFSDQLTAAVGRAAGFDEDRSGPVGWRQLMLPMVANSSLLVPVIGAALPRPWPGASLSNEAGTFTYDVRREIRSLLRAGREGERTFVAAHLTYVHLPAYPSSLELTLPELKAILRAPADRIRDRTLDWQDRDRPDDPLPLGLWKIRHVQQAIQREVTDAGYLKQGGRLVVFSDHGNRNSLNPENFGEERYHHVALATFGLPGLCPTEPISLIDIGRLLGISDVRHEPVVELAMSKPDDWPKLFENSKLRWSGEVDFDEAFLAELFAGLKKHEPYPNAPRCPQ